MPALWQPGKASCCMYSNPTGGYVQTCHVGTAVQHSLSSWPSSMAFQHSATRPALVEPVLAGHRYHWLSRCWQAQPMVLRRQELHPAPPGPGKQHPVSRVASGDRKGPGMSSPVEGQAGRGARGGQSGDDGTIWEARAWISSHRDNVEFSF